MHYEQDCRLRLIKLVPMTLNVVSSVSGKTGFLELSYRPLLGNRFPRIYLKVPIPLLTYA